MKYIDADKLIERLEEMKQAEYENCGGVNSKTGALQEVQELITSLQQEQPELVKGKFVFPNFLYARTVDNKTIDVSYAPQDMTAIEYIRNDSIEHEQPEVDEPEYGPYARQYPKSEMNQEQPKVDLEKEYNTWWKSISGKINIEHMMEWYMHETARHFYNLRNAALEKAAQHAYESWMGGTMDDFRRDIVELGKVLKARKEE